MGYLDKLNDRQRQAVEFGSDPLLVIAGAGSGKTNTLAHRVAHLLVGGANPRRILLMTFSRRAATELTRRVERITTQAMGAGYPAAAHASSSNARFRAWPTACRPKTARLWIRSGQRAAAH